MGMDIRFAIAQGTSWQPIGDPYWRNWPTPPSSVDVMVSRNGLEYCNSVILYIMAEI